MDAMLACLQFEGSLASSQKPPKYIGCSNSGGASRNRDLRRLQLGRNPLLERGRQQLERLGMLQVGDRDRRVAVNCVSP